MSRAMRWGLAFAAADALFLLAAYLCRSAINDSYTGVLLVLTQLPGLPLAAALLFLLSPLLGGLPVLMIAVELGCGIPGWFTVGYALGRFAPQARPGHPARLGAGAHR